MRKTPVPRHRRLGLVSALHALRGQLRVGVMATVYRALARRSFAASLTIAREDQVARPIPAQKECRCGEWALGPRASGWLAQSCGKHLGHMAARCSLRGSSSSCSARPKRPDKPEYQDCEGRCPTERVRRFSALYGAIRDETSVGQEYREMSKYRLIHPNTNSELNAARHRTRNSSKQS